MTSLAPPRALDRAAAPTGRPNDGASSPPVLVWPVEVPPMRLPAPRPNLRLVQSEQLAELPPPSVTTTPVAWSTPVAMVTPGPKPAYFAAPASDAAIHLDPPRSRSRQLQPSPESSSGTLETAARVIDDDRTVDVADSDAMGTTAELDRAFVHADDLELPASPARPAPPAPRRAPSVIVPRPELQRSRPMVRTGLGLMVIAAVLGSAYLVLRDHIYSGDPGRVERAPRIVEIEIVDPIVVEP